MIFLETLNYAADCIGCIEEKHIDWGAKKTNSILKIIQRVLSTEGFNFGLVEFTAVLLTESKFLREECVDHVTTKLLGKGFSLEGIDVYANMENEFCR